MVYKAGDGKAIDGLTNGGHYYIREESGKYKLYDTEEHAKAGGTTGLKDLTSVGSGSSHSLTKQTDRTADDESSQNIGFTNSKSNSVGGGSADSPSANSQIGKGNDQAKGGESKDTQSGSKSGDASSIKVAAAIGVTVLSSDSRAEIEDGAVGRDRRDHQGDRPRRLAGRERRQLERRRQQRRQRR